MLQHLGGAGYKSEGSKKRCSKTYSYLLHIAVWSQKSERIQIARGKKAKYIAKEIQLVGAIAF